MSAIAATAIHATAIGVSTASAQAPAGTTARAPAAGPVLIRTIGRTNESLPALGLGTFLTFDLLPGRNRDALRQVTRTYVDAGVRVVDTSPLYGTGEVSVGEFLSAMGVTDQMFISNKIWSTGDYLADESHALASMEQSRLRLWRDKIDVLHCHSLVNVDAIVPLLRAWKREGRIRYVGASVHENDYHNILAGLIDKDLIGLYPGQLFDFQSPRRGARASRGKRQGRGRVDKYAPGKRTLAQACRGPAAAGFCPRDRCGELGAVLYQMGDGPSSGDDCSSRDIEPGSRSRECRRAARSSAGSIHAAADGAAYG